MNKKTFVTIFFFSAVIALSYITLYALQRGNTLLYWKLLNYALYFFLIPLILTSRYQLPNWAIGLLGAVFSVLSFLSFWATGSLLFLLPMVAYIILSIGFLVLNRHIVSEVMDLELEIDRNLTKQNECQKVFEEKFDKSRALQGKYLNYYNLRKSIEDFAAYLSIEKLSRLIVAEAYEFLKKGDRAFLLLGSEDGSRLSVVATRSLDSEFKSTHDDGDFFDYWVLKNRQPLLITDLDMDFRFNVEKKKMKRPFESAIIVPLHLESSGGGVLRINSSKKDTFSIEDMRILQILSDLASTALLNSYLYTKTEELAIRDSLTGLYVHRYFKERLQEEYKRVYSKKGYVFSVLLMDLDHFKRFNDTFGHTSGDIALYKVGNKILTSVGAEGLVARYGGEEFGVVLFNANLERAKEVGERIRKSIETMSVKIRGEEHKFTISCGVAQYSGKPIEEENLIQLADEALYEAKKIGRNKVCIKT